MKLYRKYLEMRARGAGPSSALCEARSARKALDWRGERAELRRDGFDIVIEARPDECGDVSYLGSFDGEAKHPYAFRVDPDNAPWDAWQRDEHGAVCWYNPCNDPAEASAWYRENGYSKRDAKELPLRHMRRDAERLARFWNGDLCQWFVTVTASRCGIELGYDSLGGIDVDAISELSALIADHGMIDNAINAAGAALHNLTRG